MIHTTRTINPLPFEHLEPHRFEDLVRQLAYEFRNWHKLEATGRGGADDGFDARGWEIIVTDQEENMSEEESGDAPDVIEEDRIWLIQCKREKRITPARLSSYLSEIPHDESKPFGVLFVAACDFSKKTRDVFISKCRELGISEFHLWGKAELEDRLYQPNNDHLLFAYFGISLQIRKRSVKTQLRAKLAMKRKAYSALSSIGNGVVLLRDPSAEEYPYLPEEGNSSQAFKRWVLYPFHDFTVDGVRFLLQRHFAFLGDDRLSWDYAEQVNDAKIDAYNDPWANESEYPTSADLRIRPQIWDFWDKLPQKNKAWFEVYGVVAYEDILDIDKLGDNIVSNPHIYVSFTYSQKPFKRFRAKVSTSSHEHGDATEIYPHSKDDNRVKIFPTSYKTE